MIHQIELDYVRALKEYYQASFKYFEFKGNEEQAKLCAREYDITLKLFEQVELLAGTKDVMLINETGVVH